MGNDKYASCVGGVTGDSNIAEMWKNHYANLYNYPRRARSALGVDTVLTLDVCLYVCMYVC